VYKHTTTVQSLYKENDMQKIIFLACMVLANSAAAQSWEWLPGMTSAKLAASGWKLEGSAGLSWPDGRQSIVTFWSSVIEGNRMTFRCITALAADEQQTGDLCKQPVGGKE